MKQYEKSLPAEKQPELVNEFRKTLAQILGGIFVLAGLYFSWNTITATRQSIDISQSRLITERFSKAVEQLGNNKLEVRLGAIYSLERLAKDSIEDHWTIIEVLAAFIRDKGHASEVTLRDKLPEDIQAALTVIGRRSINTKKKETQIIDLSDADLRWGTLVDAKLNNVILDGSRLENADLRRVFLQEAQLIDSKLDRADLTQAHLENSVFYGVSMESVRLVNVKLMGAKLQYCDLNSADLSGADLSGVDLTGTILSGVKLSGTILKGAKGLSQEQLSQAEIDNNTILPDSLVIRK